MIKIFLDWAVVLTIELEKIIKEIEQEAEARKQLPASGESQSLKAGNFRLKPHKKNIVRRVIDLLKREKLGALRKLYRLKGIGYCLKYISILIKLPKRFEQIYAELGETTAHNQQLQIQLRNLSLQVMRMQEMQDAIRRDGNTLTKKPNYLEDPK